MNSRDNSEDTNNLAQDNSGNNESGPFFSSNENINLQNLETAAQSGKLLLKIVLKNKT